MKNTINSLKWFNWSIHLVCIVYAWCNPSMSDHKFNPFFCMRMCAFSEIRCLFKDLFWSRIWTFSQSNSWFNSIQIVICNNRLWIDISIDVIMMFSNSRVQFFTSLTYVRRTTIFCMLIYILHFYSDPLGGYPSRS